MSVELRLSTTGHCECGTVHDAGFNPTCQHWLECDWGVITNADANPERGLQPLMLATYEYVEKLLQDGPQIVARNGSINSVAIVLDENNDVRWYAHIDFEGVRTTWELFDAHFSEDSPGVGFLVGRWPD